MKKYRSSKYEIKYSCKTNAKTTNKIKFEKILQWIVLQKM